MVVSIETAEHYIWGESSRGWHLLKRDDFSIIQERVPAGGTEVMHYHTQARQFFYILDGEGTMVFEDQKMVLHKGDGLEIPPGIKHKFMNHSDTEVHFLVISVPATREDRLNC